MEVSRSSGHNKRHPRRDIDSSQSSWRSGISLSRRDMDVMGVSRRSQDFTPSTPVRALSNNNDKQENLRRVSTDYVAYGRGKYSYESNYYSRNGSGRREWDRDNDRQEYAYRVARSDGRHYSSSSPHSSNHSPTPPTHQPRSSRYHQPNNSAFYQSYDQTLYDPHRHYPSERHYPRSQARSVTPPLEDSPPLTSSGQAKSQELVMVEIEPGTQVPLRPASETVEAVAAQNYRSVTCFACSTDIYCIDDCQYYVCPMCRVISSTSTDSFDNKKQESEHASNRPELYGLGLGFTNDGLVQIYQSLEYGR